MSLSVGELHAKLDLDKRGFDRGLDHAETRGSRLGGMLAKAGKTAAVGVAAAGTALVGMGVAGVRQFAKLERGMNEVFTLLPGITDDAMTQMTDRVRQFSRDFGVLPDEVVPSLYQALSAGVPEGNVFDFLETAQKAAMGGVTDLETAVDGLTSITNAYGDQIAGAAQASDLLFTAVRLGKTDFSQLSASLFNVIPTASALGVRFQDVAAAMATMTAQGVPTSVATTQLRQLLVELSKEGSQAAGVFRDIAGKSFADFIAAGGNVADALDLMEQAAGANGSALQDMFGSVEAGQSALALAGDNAKGYRANLDEMADAAGATDAAHEKMDRGIGRAWERLKVLGNDLLLEIGERLAPRLEQFAGWAERNMPGISDAIVGAFDSVVGFIGDSVVPAFESVKAWWDENGEAITGSASDVAGGIAGAWRDLIGEFEEHSDTWEQRHARNQAVNERLGDAVGGVFSGIRDALNRTNEDLEANEKVWDGWGGEVHDTVSMLTNIWTELKEAIAGALEALDRFLNRRDAHPQTRGQVGHGGGGGAFGGEGDPALSGPGQRRFQTPMGGIPEFHTGGLARDEMLAKLRVGEEVLPRGHPRHIMSAGGDGSALDPDALGRAIARHLDARQVNIDMRGREDGDRGLDGLSTPQALAAAVWAGGL